MMLIKRNSIRKRRKFPKDFCLSALRNESAISAADKQQRGSPNPENHFKKSSDEKETKDFRISKTP